MSTTKKYFPQQTKLTTVSNYLSTVKDHRMVNKCKHKLSDILFIGLLTYFKIRSVIDTTIKHGQDVYTALVCLANCKISEVPE
jgi:hypothetical protein